MDLSDADARWMSLALREAAAACGRTRPNPPVGCVLVRDGVIVGAGHTQPPPGPHAEAVALAAAGERARGATAYVTLEPCSHHGRTPPCADALAAAGVQRVVAAVRDPHAQATGGLEVLEAVGVETAVGPGAERAGALLAPFLHWARTGMPYVFYKYAMTLDGKTATPEGKPMRISSPASFARIHRLRERLGAVMVGVNTILADDSLLTVRRQHSELPPRCRPVRIVVDTHLRVAPESRLVRSVHQAPLIFACGEQAGLKRIDGLRDEGVIVLVVHGAGGRVDLAKLMLDLGRRGITGVLLEGGGALAASMLQAGLVQRVCAYVAPVLSGGSRAPTPVGGEGLANPLPRLGETSVRRSGADWRIEGDVTRD